MASAAAGPPQAQGRDSGRDGGAAMVGSYWKGRSGGMPDRDMPPAIAGPGGAAGGEEGRGVDAYRRMVYDDLLVSAARRSHGGMDLASLEDNRRQYYENHKALRLEAEREKDRQWEHEKWVHSERQMEAMREQDRSHQREHEWERLFRGETEREREVERRFEDERRELRGDWEQEKRFEREKEEQRGREWDKMRKVEQDRMRRKLDEFREEVDREKRQWSERQLQWEAEKRKYMDDWGEDDKKERQAWEQWYSQLKEEHGQRKKKWDKEKADLKKEYLALEDRDPHISGGAARGGGAAESIQHEDVDPGISKAMQTEIIRCHKKAQDSSASDAIKEELNLMGGALWIFVRHDVDSDGFLGPEELATMADVFDIDARDELMGCGGGPEVNISKWLEWFHTRKEKEVAAAVQLEQQIMGPKGEDFVKEMTDDDFEKHFQHTSDLKLKQGIREMRKARHYFKLVFEQDDQQAALQQSKDTVASMDFAEEAKNFIAALEQTPDYQESGYADTAIEGEPSPLRTELEAIFASAAGGRTQLSLKDPSFDSMLRKLSVSDFSPQDRAVTEAAWGDMDFDKFFAWCSTRKDPDYKPVLGEPGQLKALLE